MTIDGYKRAIEILTPDEGDAFHVFIELCSGVIVRGAVHNPIDGVVRVDPVGTGSPTIVDIASIVAIRRD